MVVAHAMKASIVVLLHAASLRKGGVSLPVVTQPCRAVVRLSEALCTAWDRGDGANSMRPLVESLASSPEASGAAVAVSSSAAAWSGLWEARIEHFEKVAFTGLRVRPHYEFDTAGAVVSHVHLSFGPVKGWGSASGVMKPANDGTPVVRLIFDDFWVSTDGPRPREAPAEGDASAADTITRALGCALFFDGLASFPVEYADMERGLIACA